MNKDKLNLLFGNILFALFQWTIVFIIARFNGVESVGLYSLATMIVTPIFLLLSLQLRVKIATDNEQNFKDEVYIFLRFITCILALFLSTLVSISLSPTTHVQIFFSALVFVVGFLKSIEFSFDLIYGIYQRSKMFNIYGNSLILRSIFSIVLFVITDFYIQSFLIALVVVIFTQLLVLSIFDRHHFGEFSSEYSYNNVNIKDSINLFQVTLPLGIAAFLDSLIINGQRMIISKELTLYDLGLFSVFFQLVLSLQIFILTLGQYYIPKISEHYKSNKAGFFSLVINLYLFSILFGVLLYITTISTGDLLPVLIFGDEFKGSRELFISFSIVGGMIYLSTISSYCLIGIGLFKHNLFAIFISLIVTLSLTLILVRSFGVIGASYSVAVGYFLKFIISISMFIYETNFKKRNFK